MQKGVTVNKVEIEVEADGAGIFDVATEAARMVDSLICLRSCAVIVDIARDKLKGADLDGVKYHLTNAAKLALHGGMVVDQSGLTEDDPQACVDRFAGAFSERIDRVTGDVKRALRDVSILAASDPNGGFAYASLALLNRYRRNNRFDTRVTLRSAGSTYIAPGQFAACAYIFAGMADLSIAASDDFLSFTATADDADGEIVADYNDPESLYFHIANEIECNNMPQGVC